jgi:CheY-like chemotaxis protein
LLIQSSVVGKVRSSVPIRTILLVDDQTECRVTTKLFLANFGYSVVAAGSAQEALAVFDPNLHDLVVTDNRMPGISGVELAHIIKLRSPSTPIVMFTGQAPADRACLDAVVQRPAHLLALKEAIEKLKVEIH